MNILQALILSFVEGITEFLPISSTGHLILVSDLLNIRQTEFVKSFEIIIQLGAILAVVFLYWRHLTQNRSLWKNLFIAFIPTALVGLIFYTFIKEYLIGNSSITVVALFIGGIILILTELYFKKRKGIEIDNLTWKKAFLIGGFQSFSIIPGVSRAAATILGGMFLGLKRESAVEFSFLLAVPTMFAATGLDLIKSDFAFQKSELGVLIIGLLGSFVTAFFTIKFFLKFIKNNNFISFGVYRIVLSLIFWIFLL